MTKNFDLLFLDYYSFIEELYGGNWELETIWRVDYCESVSCFIGTELNTSTSALIGDLESSQTTNERLQTNN